MLILKSVNFEQRQFQNHHLKQSYPGQTEWLVGRNTTCDLILPNPEVSRVHGRIVYSDDAYFFVDNGSMSGSFLNGKTVPVNDKHPIHPGDLIQLGETFLYVEGALPPAPSLPVSDPTAGMSLLRSDKQWTEEDLVCRCCRIVDETPDVKTFYFMAEPAVLFSYQPGQFANLEVEIDGKPVMRSYSISSSPTRPYHLSMTIKRVPAPRSQPDVPAGLVSNWLHDHLQVGDRVKLVGGPMGHFTCLPHLPAKMLLISAGSGVTPMISMSRWVQDTLAESDILFLHSARTSDDIVSRAELEAIAAQMPNFHLFVTLTQQPLGRSWMGLNGRISDSMLQLIAPDLRDRAVFVCGSQEFMSAIRSTLEGLQFPMENYKEESFGGKKAAIAPPAPPAPPSSAPGSVIWTLESESMTTHSRSDTPAEAPARSQSETTNPVIRFLKSEQEVVSDDSTSILEIAEQEGIHIRHACRVGACGACKVRVTKGEVRYDTPPMALTPADQQAGYALACVAYPIEQVAVEA